jgi:hypothetical protein
MKGFPDLFGICQNRPGVLFVIEVKTEKGKLRKDQEKWLKILDELGCVCVVGRCAVTVLKDLESKDRLLVSF